MFAKYHAVFRSRWRAAMWACGVLLTAYCTVPSAEQTERKEEKARAAHRHVNPWAVSQRE
ncbi:MAG: hypothetical protein ABIT09_01530 [Croceibacterium sp.]